MKIISWNVNSIKARLSHVLDYLQQEQPDVLMIQELKGLEFPAAEFDTIQYETIYKAQKSYNGVAVITKQPANLIHNTLPGDEADEQARFIEFQYGGLRMINIYAPNGNPCPGKKYDYKLRWMQRLTAHIQTLRDQNVAFLIGGDFNVIPADTDCHNPAAWSEDALFRLETRAAFRSLIHLGLTDAFRARHPHAKEAYTFWDYQAGAWTKNNGIRIDHFLLSPALTDRLKDCRIDNGPRAWDSPSDHTPIVLEID